MRLSRAVRTQSATDQPAHWNFRPEVLQGVAVLAISSDPSEHRAIRGLFNHTNWVLDCAETLKDAWTRIERAPSPVILVSHTLHDGTWSDLLERLPSSPDTPRVIVSTNRMDPQLYEDVLHSGGFDVITVPYKAAQLYPVISDAWRQWKFSSSRGVPAKAIATFA